MKNQFQSIWFIPGRRMNRRGLSLIEVVIVVVIMTILAAVIVPQFRNSTDDAIRSTAEFHLDTLRTQIDVYRRQHAGRLPGPTLRELTRGTDVSGEVGRGPAYSLGPYIREIPANPYSGISSVSSSSASPIPPDVVTGYGGWIYNPNTGEIRIDNKSLFSR